MLTRLILSLTCAAATAAPVSFQNEVAPLLQRRCGSCHDEDSAKGHYRLDSFTRLKKAGESDLPPVVAGKPEESELYLLLRESSAEDRMPQKADPLPDSETELIQRWIREGAEYDGGSPDRPLVELVRHTMLGDPPRVYRRPLPAAALAFSPDGRQIAVGGYHEVTIWSIPDGFLATRLAGLPEKITSIVWHPTLPLLAIAGGTPMQWGTVALVDPAGINGTQILCDLPDTALSVAFSPDGTLLAAGSADRTVRVFDAISARQTRVVKAHADWVQNVSFDHNSRQVLSASKDRTARVIDATKGEVTASYTSHETPLLAAVFSPDGREAWTLARGGILDRWDAGNGERKGEVKSADLQQITMTPAGLVATTATGSLRLYPPTSEKLARTFDLPERSPASCVASADGTMIAIGGFDGKITIMASPKGSVVSEFVAQPR